MRLRRFTPYLVTAACVLGLGGVGFALYRHFRGRPQERYRYEARPADRGSIRVTVSSTGVIQPKTTIDLKSNAGGEVTRMLVEVGDYVHKGQLVATIDPTDAKTQLTQAQADRRAAQWRINQAQYSVDYGLKVDEANVADSRKA